MTTMTVIITTSGGQSILTGIMQVQYVKLCPYLEDHEFKTSDPDQRFCCANHRVNYCRKHSGVTTALSAPPSKPSTIKP